MKLKLLFLLIGFFLYATQIYPQLPNWQWAKSAGGNGEDKAYSITTDFNGDEYVVGYFYSPSITFGTTTLTNTSAGMSDIFIVKYAPNGSVIWAQSVGGNDRDEAQAVTTDIYGNILVTGFFQSPTITFGSTTLTNAGGENPFIVKIDSNGNIFWAKSVACQSILKSSVTVDALNNIYLSANFVSTSVTIGSYTLINNGAVDLFLVKYDQNGNVIWAKGAGGAGSDLSFSIASDTNQNIYVSGFFDGSNITFGSATLISSGIVDDMFLVKYDSSGNVIWARTPGGNSDDIGYSVAVDTTGNILVSGYFLGSSIVFDTTTLTGVNGADIFIAKYDTNGNVIWAKKASGNNDEIGFSVTCDTYGNIYMAGYFISTNLAFDSTTLTNVGGEDIFLAKYDGNGNAQWAKNIGGSSYEDAYSVTTDALGGVYIVGRFSSSSIAFDTTILINAGGDDMFIAKLSNDSILSNAPVANLSAPNSICPGTCNDFTNLSLNATSYQWFFNGAIPDTSTSINPQSICYNIPGIYDVTLIASNSNGNDTLTLNNYITVFPFPLPQGIQQSGDTLIANLGSASYQWYLNGNIINGATNYFYAALTSGDYNVVCTDSNGCEVEAAIFNVIATTTALSNSEREQIEVYPNPAKTSFTISFFSSSTSVNIEIDNATGESMCSYKLNTVLGGNKIEVNQNYSSGIYILKITDIENIIRQKIIIE